MPQQVFCGQIWRSERKPGHICRIRVLPCLDPLLVGCGFFVGSLAAIGRKAFWFLFARKISEVIARPRKSRVMEITGGNTQAPLGVKIADEGIERQHRKGGIHAGSCHHATVGVRHRLLAVSGKLARQTNDGFAGNAAQGRVFLNRMRQRFFFKKLQSCGCLNPGTIWQCDFAAKKQFGFGAFVGGHHLATGRKHKRLARQGFTIRPFALGLRGHTQYLALP